jgi:hypothetical protein
MYGIHKFLSSVLNEGDQVLQMHVHGQHIDALRDPEVDRSYDFDAVTEFD